MLERMSEQMPWDSSFWWTCAGRLVQGGCPVSFMEIRVGEGMPSVFTARQDQSDAFIAGWFLHSPSPFRFGPKQRKALESAVGPALFKKYMVQLDGQKIKEAVRTVGWHPSVHQKAYSDFFDKCEAPSAFRSTLPASLPASCDLWHCWPCFTPYFFWGWSVGHFGPPSLSSPLVFDYSSPLFPVDPSGPLVLALPPLFPPSRCFIFVLLLSFLSFESFLLSSLLASYSHAFSTSLPLLMAWLHASPFVAAAAGERTLRLLTRRSGSLRVFHKPMILFKLLRFYNFGEEAEEEAEEMRLT